VEPAVAKRPVRVRDTIENTLTFEGRTTRTEVANYGFVALLATVMVALVAGYFAAFDLRNLLGNILACVIAIPVPAMLIRRYHDQDRTGRWVWLAVIVFAVWAVRAAVSQMLGLDARLALDAWIWPLDWLITLANIATILLIVLPGTKGVNRFGPDPREREV
jgi:uncharacterized membrane protein YhaH (DUF805 family)